MAGWRFVPSVPKALGLTGLVPFYALCPPILGAAIDALAATALTHPVSELLLYHVYPYSGHLQVGYGAVIVSFLGAVHWGAAMQSRSGHTTKIMFERYVWSVAPALVVFPTAAMGVQTGSAVVASALLATLAIDAKFSWKGALPLWYMSLRIPLAAGSIAAMLITFWFTSPQWPAPIVEARKSR
jgi:hypothetical protein